MAGPTDQPESPNESTPVPDLIERYRVRRDAWIAQADELARLRDEVRGSAEREAMEIVTAARRDVRKVIMEARRELLVLSAQVQAALGEVTAKTDPAALLDKAGITPDSSRPVLPAGDAPSAAEVAVNEILSEVHEDMASLAEDARAVPLQVVPLSRPDEGLLMAPAVPEPQLSALAATESSPPHPWAPLPEIEVTGRDTTTDPQAVTETASNTLLSGVPSDAVPVETGKRVSTFVTAFVAIGVIVAGATIWWFTFRNAGPSQSSAATTPPKSVSPPAGAPAASASPARPSTPDAASTSPATGAAAGNLSIVAEAVRDVWVRTTIDGRTDNGRTLATGQVIDVSAEQSISLRVGDAGAIVVSVNHGEKRPLGRDGQVMTREFVAKGTKQPEPDPAPAPQAPAPRAPASTSPAPPIAAAPPALVPAAPTPRPAAPVSAPIPQPLVSTPPAPPPANQIASAGSQPVAPPVVTQQSVPAPAPAPPAQPAASGSPATEVVAAARQWLEAYHRQDRAAMQALSADNLLLADERRLDERFAPGTADVTRTLDRVSVQIAADTAVLTAVMIESSSASPSHVSPISQVWVLGGGQWRVRQARFVSEARLNQAFK